jgi:hypothetical protein
MLRLLYINEFTVQNALDICEKFVNSLEQVVALVGGSNGLSWLYFRSRNRITLACIQD